jgi:hypothetical protein
MYLGAIMVDEAIGDRSFVLLGLTYPSPLAKIYDFPTID